VPVFSKVLVANRGEIALRVIRALKELAIGSVAVYSEVDREAPHVREADESYLLGPGPAPESYLNVDKILDVAGRSGAEALHPGYGFLAENAAFAATCEKAGVVFIGPPAAAIEAMGSKTKARELMSQAGVPIVPGTTSPVGTLAQARKHATQIGYPIAVKAAGGGGGKGFRVAAAEKELEKALEGASREGEKFFSDPTVYLERYLEDPRHVEVQVLADAHGNVVHLGERDCSVQRRHQKLIEETPAPGVDEAFRERIGKIAIDAARAIGYRSAGTVEGLLASDGEGEREYFFLEMNTRIQVEHPVTELATGIDIVREQIRVAAGERLSFSQEEVAIRRASIECRINAEAAHKKFAPAPGKITGYREPAGPGVRVDSGVEAGSEITPLYDPLIAKLIVADVDREAATRRMLRALDEFEIEGLATLIPFHKALLRSEQWARGETCRDLVEDAKWLKSLAPEADAPAQEKLEEDEEKVERAYTVEVNSRRFSVKVIGSPPAGAISSANSAASARRPPRRERAAAGPSQDGASEALVSPIQGTVLRVHVKKGQEVDPGAVICVVEAMKMENEITAHRAGKVAELNVTEGGSVASGDTIAVIK
jgi:acetyl-CoA/propionyl-CoA carboxylase, biotin carboxylase, biotin carboxyl carrier protein